MPRAVAYSHKQKKKYLKDKRAVKRGEEVDDLAPKSNGTVKLDRSAAARSVAHDGLALDSRFLAIPRDYGVLTRNTAYADVLPRPLPDSAAAFPLHLVDNPAAADLTVPSRPKFQYGQTKREVEKNEEGMFRTWLDRAGSTVEDWFEGADIDSDSDSEGSEHPKELRSPSSFETNLEVWRQLWRVVEASSIVLLPVDARCPAVHCPPSLRAYLRSLRPRREIILVLTKSDLVDAGALAGWRAWLRDWWVAGPSSNQLEDEHEPQIVSVSAYDTSLLYGEGRARLRPHIPDNARAALLDALRTAHTRLLQPPASVKADPQQLAAWTPSVRENVHWADLEKDTVSIEAEDEPEHESQVKQHARAKGENATSGSEGDSDDNDNATPRTRDPQSEPLTFGLVGQPNVGKSSLLNALLGTMRVRASKTPGKTKHWQTILWGPKREVRIVDCPGLVCPSLVPMELQAMSGILPISQIPSLSACIAFAGKHIPLERVFRLSSPPVVVDDIESKRTWRIPRVADNTPKGPRWTAGDIMDRRAIDRGMMTAKSGRPDNNRAANNMMRALADGRVRWGFWPPGAAPHREGYGLWLGEWREHESDPDHKHDDAVHQDLLDEDSDEEEEEEEEEATDDETDFAKANNASFFAALSLGNDDDDDDDDNDE